ncbi:Holliday junction branch migration protein RuvA [Roseburia sp. MSJ-14]|uniref:Holliday junction branch migration protein RuvA n=1 Tax=Roseburia sp. MSJ-14 TaxID=2841514 RepID=UPI001C127C53|nr:Holliday junction branch migration protein RuvA [Roseburia sp. MSJ-14]MBU5472823.1 Holliday junction branch migration protein RuvA [Roseburia sp. MSJ-14]
MYSYIKGELVEILDDVIVVEAGQIGYNIHIPASMIDNFTGTGQEVKIYTYLQVKEDDMQLYGFLTRDDLNIFKLLLGVNGIGPKGALAVLSVMTPDDLRFAVLGEDAKSIAKAPGIGNKTAQRVILELKDKISLEDAFEAKTVHVAEGQSVTSSVKNEAVQALTALGYSSSEALKAVSGVELTEDITVEEVLKEALKQMAFL